MSLTFIHTADWQLGKPFAGVQDAHKRALLQEARVQAVFRIAEEVRERNAAFVVVSGDLFDSSTPLNSTVSSACSAIRAMEVPVFVIPGNHDHGGAGSVWHQPFFQREQAQLAPNLRVLLSHQPVEHGGAVLLPCPLLRRHELADPTACLRGMDGLEQYGAKARIVLAHGSTHDFGESLADDEEFGAQAANTIDLPRLREEDFDYIALGDWHGTKQITRNAWYSGTPEPDRFAKGTEHAQGAILVVQAARGQAPLVERVPTAGMVWHEVSFGFGEDRGPARLAAGLDALLGARANQALLRLRLEGALAMQESAALDQLIETLQSRLIRLKLDNAVLVAPSEAELQGLTSRAADPLIARVAARLAQASAAEGPDALVARAALRELYLAAAA